ncbi:succinylglutamate desuccinylase [Bordetella pertussis]|nr:succinylglutamate desuccinylase [Bordetella pertussis]CFM24505.1 succinylglutamate desuccinylase [Bordetella pertussis]CFO02873.1 succinylglutamate desuccinylase [Bordetella pertussis]CFO08721.1 succinylglutamate desuccinylase [Bordetella pertussis]CFO44517.1 succinylglutamate desuccinylase [Bordetella pertussis]
MRQGELVGTRADGRQVLAPRDGYVVFPNPRALAGNEWFYFAVASDRLGEDAGN